MPVSRRSFLTAAGTGGALLGCTSSALLALSPGASAASMPAAGAGVDELFPTQPPALVRELVTVAHFDAARVRELVGERPSLARAAWDWGFGDWESALGAASHMGNQEIAEFLLAHGARPDLFSSAMLGHLEVVKAQVMAWPGAQRIKGPHGITLLAHARAGGERALPVLRFLETLGDADPVVPIQLLPPEDHNALLGHYRFGPQPRDVFSVEAYKEGLSLRRAESMGRPLAHLGGRVFSPAGADAVRIRFSDQSPALSLCIHDPAPVITAQRAVE